MRALIPATACLVIAGLLVACGGDGGEGGAAGTLSFLSDRARDGVSELYTVNPDGSGLAKVELGPLPPDSRQTIGGVDWSPDGRRLVFNSGEAFLEGRGNKDVYAADADGSGLTRLTDDPAPDFLPKWSPDGTRIAFLSARGGNLDVYVMNADGSGQTRLTEDPGEDSYGFFLFYPDPWSPDGRRLAFNRAAAPAAGGAREIQVWLMNADGSGQTALAAGSFAGWSPDGQRVLLMEGAGDEGYKLSAVAADGGGRTAVVDLSGQSPQGFPVWSPDGRRIAYTAERDGKQALHVVDAGGGGAALLTSGAGASEFEGCDGLFGAAWSPAGDRIVYTSGCDFEKAVLMVVNANGTGETRIVEAPAFFPAWRPGR